MPETTRADASQPDDNQFASKESLLAKNRELQCELDATRKQLKSLNQQLVALNNQRDDEATKKTRLERELRTSKERLEQIADRSDYIFWIRELNPESVVYVSSAFERVWGLSAEELRTDARLWAKAIHEDDAENVRRKFERWVSDPNNEVFDVEYRIVRASDGEIRWIHDRGSVIRQDKGIAERFTGVARDITKSKLAAKQLEETQSQLKTFLDNAPLMMGLVELHENNSDILHLMGNHAAEESLGAKHGELTGKWAVRDLGLSDQTRNLWISRFAESQQRHEPVRFVYDVGETAEDDSQPKEKRRLNMTVSHVGTGAQGRERFCYVAIDDTQRLRTEMDLQTSQQTFADLLANAPFGLYLVDDDLIVREVSRGAEKTFESAQPVIGRGLEEVLRVLWPEQFASEAISQFRHTLKTGEPYETTETTEQRDDIDAIESYHWQLQRIVLPNNKLGVVCYFYDLTPIRRAEFALRQSEGRLRLAAELARVGIVRIDYRTNQAVLDSIAASLFGLPENEPVPRKKVHERFHPKDHEHLLEEIEATCNEAESGIMSIQHRIIQPNGAVKWLDVCKRIYFDQRPGKAFPTATHAVAVIIDITSQKEYETKLHAARMQAETANRARGEFLANMSHEIRTPMTAILGYADMLGEHLHDPDNRQCVDTIQRNGRFLLDIINDILDLSKIDAGKMEFDRERIPPQAIVADVVALMNVRAEEKQIDLIAEFNGELPVTIETDGKRLRQILLNLVGNAIKFTSEGSVHVKSRFNPKTVQIEFEVADTGVGIDEDELESLFEPFTQTDTSHTRTFGGTGLGLAISRRLAQRLGGDIRANSRPGHGSTFMFAVDAGPVDNVSFAVPSLERTTPPERGSNISLSGRVLIVDDRRDIRFLAQNFVEQAGGTVLTANNGQEGVMEIIAAQKKGEPLSVVLMDMQMPIMDGYAAATEIRRRGVDVPIIALTANAMSEDREKCLEAGCTDFLTKPLDKKLLIAMIAKYGRH